MILVSKGGSSELEVCVCVWGGGVHELHETPQEPRQECHTKTLSGSATIKRTVSDCQIEVLSGAFKIKLLPGSITIKHTARECHD